MIELVLAHFPAERIAVDSQDFRGARLVPVQSFEHTLDEFLLKLRYSFFEQNSTINHHADQRFQLIFQVCAPGLNPGNSHRF